MYFEQFGITVLYFKTNLTHNLCTATVYKIKNMGHWAYNNNNININNINNNSNYYNNNVDIIKLQNKGGYVHVKVYFK